MGNSIAFLELPVQLFVAGSAIGVVVAWIDYLRTGSLDRWGPIVTTSAAASLFASLLFQAVLAVT